MPKRFVTTPRLKHFNSLSFLSSAYWRKRIPLLLSCLFIMTFAITLVSSGISFSSSLQLETVSLQASDLRVSALSRDGVMPFGNELRLVEGVEEASPVLFRKSYLRNATGQAISVFGVDPLRYLEGNQILLGRSLDKYDVRSIVVSNSLAQELDLKRFDTAWLATTEGFQDYIVTGIVQTKQKLVLMPIDEAQLVFTSGLPLVSWYDLKLTNKTRISSLHAEILAILPSTTTIQTRAGPVSGGLLKLKIFLSLFLLLGLTASIFLLLSNLALIKLERRQDIKVLHALGLSKGVFLQLIRVEMLILLVFAAAMSGFVSMLLRPMWTTVFHNHVFSFVPIIMPEVNQNLSLLAIVAVVSLIFSAVVTRGLRNQQQFLGKSQESVSLRSSMWINYLPKPLWLGQKLLSSFRKRDAYVFGFLIVSMSMGVALFSTVSNYQGASTAWLQNLDSWDLLVTQKDAVSGISIPFSESVQKKLELLPGVSAVTSDYKTSIQQGELRANLFISDLSERPLKSTHGVATEVLNEVLKNGRNIAIAESLATLYDLDAGNTLTLITPTGEKSYEIVAIVDDLGAEPRGIFIDQVQYNQDWQLSAADLFAVSISDKANASKIAKLIEQELSATYLVDVRPVSEFYSESSAIISKSFSLGQVVVSVLLIFAGLATLNLLTERLPTLKKDLSLLKALGASAKVLKQSLLSHFILSSVASLIIALGLGTALSFLSIHLLKYSGRFTLAWSWPASVYGMYLFVGVVLVVVISVVMNHNLEKHLTN